MILRKKEVYTVITPIPSHIPRQLAIDILHSHGEVITLNPLVLDHKQIKAPRDAAADEYFSTWYEITERIQYIPGIGKLGSGVINFNGCFHDLPWGLQTHIYAPANVDLRNKYRIGGNQPGVEPPEQHEMGLAALGAPKDGLYLREDIEIRCNIAMVGMVKSQMKTASKDMVQRIIKKAELLDSGVLQAMIEDGKIKTINPNDKTYTGGLSQGMQSPQSSPGNPYFPPHSPSIPYQVPRPISLQQQQQHSRPGTAGSQGYPAHWQNQQQQQQAQQNPYDQGKAYRHAHEMAAPVPPPAAVMELPGDMHHASPHLQPPQPSPTHHHQSPQGRTSLGSGSSQPPHSPDPRWSQSQPSPSLMSSRPTSYSSDPGGGGGGSSSSAGYASPGLDHKGGFASELPTHPETQEEYRSNHRGDQRDPRMRASSSPFRPYNPADYANVSR